MSVILVVAGGAIWTPLRRTLLPVPPTLSVEALQDRLAPVEPAAAAVRPVGVEGGVVSTEGVVPAPLLFSASPTPLQPASSTVVVVAARSNKTFMRNMRILTAWPAHSLPWPAQRTLAGIENQRR